MATCTAPAVITIDSPPRTVGVRTLESPALTQCSSGLRLHGVRHTNVIGAR